MNYIAHIQLANITNTCVVGNFLGDFVKGSDLSQYSLAIQAGIRLHRKIDTFTDSHELIANLRAEFPKSIRRMSGIALDVYFDHLLCTHWLKYNDKSLDEVLQAFYCSLETQFTPDNKRFLAVKAGLLQHKWLANYVHKESCIGAFSQIEKRLNYKVVFAQEATRFLHDKHEMIDSVFQSFYPLLISYCHSLTANNAQLS